MRQTDKDLLKVAFHWLGVSHEDICKATLHAIGSHPLAILDYHHHPPQSQRKPESLHMFLPTVVFLLRANKQQKNAKQQSQQRLLGHLVTALLHRNLSNEEINELLVSNDATLLDLGTPSVAALDKDPQLAAHHWKWHSAWMTENMHLFTNDHVAAFMLIPNFDELGSMRQWPEVQRLAYYSQMLERPKTTCSDVHHAVQSAMWYLDELRLSASTSDGFFEAINRARGFIELTWGRGVFEKNLFWMLTTYAPKDQRLAHYAAALKIATEGGRGFSADKANMVRWLSSLVEETRNRLMLEETQHQQGQAQATCLLQQAANNTKVVLGGIDIAAVNDESVSSSKVVATCYTCKPQKDKDAESAASTAAYEAQVQEIYDRGDGPRFEAMFTSEQELERFKRLREEKQASKVVAEASVV